MKMKVMVASAAALALSASLLSCTSTTNPATVTGPDAKALVTAISNGIKAVGTGMVTARNSRKESRISSSSCDVHGYPNGLSQGDPNYPGYLTYCFTTVDEGDTVLGGFSTPAFVGCLIAAAGVTYDGVEHSATITSAVITACGADGSGLPDGATLKVTGSAPASFNASYDHGVVVDLHDTLGLTFKMGMNTSGTKAAFITNESWTDGSIGAAGGSFDSATGDLWYEARNERNNCETHSRCGWNRHTRIHAGLTVAADGTPSGLNSVSFAYSNVQYTPGQDALAGVLVTAKGDLTDGIKARLWQATDGAAGAVSAASQYDTVGNWTETTNTKCYTHSSEVAGTCGTGLDKFSTSTKFALSASDSHTAVDSWFTSITGQTFSNVDVDSDTQF